MKKNMLIALILLLTLSVFVAVCSAALLGMANTTKKGSLVVWPLIKVGPDDEPWRDTIITFSNDYTSKVAVMCCYKYPVQPNLEDPVCQHECFDFSLTGSQEVSWSARTGLTLDGTLFPKSGQAANRFKDFEGTGDHDDDLIIGELKCWAVDGSKNPISFNWLSGTAVIGEGPDMTWQYSAYRHRVGNDIANKGLVGEAGDHTLLLTGTSTTYDACPSGLLFNIIEQTDNESITRPTFPVHDSLAGPEDYRTVKNVLTLVPCKQDLVDDNNTIVRAYINVYNENESSSYANTCVGCGQDNASIEVYTESLLSSKFHENSVFTNLKGTPGGVIYVTSESNGSNAQCQGSTAYIPMYGVMSTQTYSINGPIAGEAATLLGPPQPYVLQDGSPTYPVAIKY